MELDLNVILEVQTYDIHPKLNFLKTWWVNFLILDGHHKSSESDHHQIFVEYLIELEQTTSVLVEDFDS